MGGYYYYLNDNAAYLPASVMDWAGLETSGGWVDSSGSLTSMNDKGKSFEEIAKKIEEKL